MNRYDETWQRLLEWTRGQTPSERLAAQIVLEGGFENVDPIHPLGGKDGGKDALMEKDGEPWIMSVYFPRGQQSYNEIEKKFIADFAGVAKNEAKGMAFVTNQELKEGERRDLAKAVGGPTEIFHLERLAAILDRPKMAGLRLQYLDIDFGPEGLEPAARLEEMMRASVARCAQRWRAVGLPREEASELAEDRSIGRVSGALGPDPSRPTVIWTAKIGAGKSIAAEREHQAAIQFALEEPEAPLPVFLHARDAVGGLADACAGEAAEVGEPRQVGARVIVDGLDEVGQEIAAQLLGQARILCGTWPNTTVLLVSRPVQIPLDPDEHFELPPLSEAEAHACVELGAGRGVSYGELAPFPKELEATLVQPLFALLAGLWLRGNEGLPRAPIDLLGELGRRAAPSDTDRTLLRKLATRSVARDLGSVSTGEVVKPAQRISLLDSGIVIEEAGRLEFALPALAQWFAAEAILESEFGLEEILKAPDDLELWLYPMALSISYGSGENAEHLVGGLLESEPGFALRVLDTVFKQAVLEGSPAPPWRDAGEAIRASLERLRDALAPAGPLLTDSDDDGGLAPMAIATNGTRLTVAFYRGADKGSLSELPNDVDIFRAGPEWGSLRAAPVGPGAAWAWRWSRDVIKDGFKRLVRQRAFPIAPDGPLAEEEVWSCAVELEGKSFIASERFEIEKLIRRINELALAVSDNPVAPVVRLRYGRHDLMQVLAYLRRLEGEGRSALEAPIQPPDQLDAGHWIGELYSDERLVTVAEEMYLRAIQAYREIVDAWLPSLAPQLEHRVLLPMKIVAFLQPGRMRGEAIGMVIPTLAGYLEALPDGTDSEVDVRIDEANYDYSVADGNFEAQKAARPNARRWLQGTHGGLTFEVGKKSAVADVVYDWLGRDLHRLGVVDRLDGGSSNGSTVWASRPPTWEELFPGDTP
ncbi:MAG TPA: hypothetical protein VG816_06555 [Solirubrobacterales bacterium]|nr:hypothetical protein [Solirubrobacterales bacterium]